MTQPMLDGSSPHDAGDDSSFCRFALGVLGGMGPLAGADFLRKLIIATPAVVEQDHLPVIMLSDSRIEDRNMAILSGEGDGVLRKLKARAGRLVEAGAVAIAIPCNTAHHWYDELQRDLDVPIIHIADAAIRRLIRTVPAGAKVTVFATRATLMSGFYEARLIAAGYDYHPLADHLIESCIVPCYQTIKAGDQALGRRVLQAALDHSSAAGVKAILLACTELPIAMQHELATDPTLVDATEALAEACVAWWQQFNDDRAACVSPGASG